MFSIVSNHVIIYNAGDGNDLILMFGSNNTLNIVGDNYSTAMSGENVIITVGTSKITLDGSGRDGREMPQIVGTYGTSTVTAATPVNTTPAATATAMTTSTPIVSSSYVYAGGDQIISNYANEPIVLGTPATGAFFGGGNFALTSPTGTLLIQNANDKIISFTDNAGNPYAKAYAATNPGVIDGRGLAGYEVITGSDFGNDFIYAGDGGSQLWGGGGFGQDILTGGGGADIFIGGKNQGADIFMNASSADTVNLNDATLSDIVAANEVNGAIALAFNNGNAVAVQSSELLSANFTLADGSAYRYNHAAKVWQNA